MVRPPRVATGFAEEVKGAAQHTILVSCSDRQSFLQWEFAKTAEDAHHSFAGAVIVGRRYLYTGNANLTYCSDNGNGELVYRMVGQVVLDAIAVLDADRARGSALA